MKKAPTINSTSHFSNNNNSNNNINSNNNNNNKNEEEHEHKGTHARIHGITIITFAYLLFS